jgi:hypothetical protein
LQSKTIKVLYFALLICFISTVNTFALDNNQIITPKWTALDMVFQSFSIEDGIAAVSASTTAHSSANEVDARAYLQQQQNGSWKTVKSWYSIKDRSLVLLEQTYYVVK